MSGAVPPELLELLEGVPEPELGVLRVRLLIRTAIAVLQTQREAALETTALRHIEHELEHELVRMRHRRAH